MIDLTPWLGERREIWPRLRQAIQATVAACLSYVVVDLVGAPQGFWAVMTAILVTQANIGASLGLAIDRLLGSLLGVVVGGAVALALADVQELKFAGLAAIVLVLGYFSARRPSLRIACVTAAIVLLGDPRLGPPISSAGNRMIEVLIGTVVAILTTLIIFPSRAGPAFAAHITRTFAPLFSVLHQTLAAALGQPLDEAAMRTAATRIRAAFATGDSLARETQMEAAGYLAEHSDPDAVLRTLRRLWHTEIMLWRSVAQPLPAMAVAALRPDIERLSAALDAVCARLMQPGVSYVAPDLSAVEAALDAIERQVEDMRARGALRELSMDDVIRLMAFDFALGQLRHNMRDLAERSQELASFAGATSPLLQRVRAVLGRS